MWRRRHAPRKTSIEHLGVLWIYCGLRVRLRKLTLLCQDVEWNVRSHARGRCGELGEEERHFPGKKEVEGNFKHLI